MLDLTTKILVVDDIAMSRRLLVMTLSALGFINVTEAANGAEALVHLERGVETKQSFQIVFCDWDMPQMTGFELLKRVRANELLAATYFILVTGKSEKQSVMDAAHHSVNGYLLKPFAPEQVQMKLASLEGHLKKVG